MNVCGYEKYIFLDDRKALYDVLSLGESCFIYTFALSVFASYDEPNVPSCEDTKLVVGHSGNVCPVTGIAFHYTNCVVSPFSAFCFNKLYKPDWLDLNTFRRLFDEVLVASDFLIKLSFFLQKVGVK